MSRSTEPRARRDDGFTLLEVVVALGVTTLVMAAMLPQLVAGLRSTGTANAVTAAKGVVQAELERMRNLPYHVAPSAGGYVDVLDRYYPDLAAPIGTAPCTDPTSGTATAWTGFVAAGSAERCAFEPATGAFYRTVRSIGTARGPMVMVVATQFLSSATPPKPVTPRPGYDSRTTGRHLPASSQLGVTATVVHGDRGAVRPVTTYTQVVAQPSAPSRIRGEARATAIQVGSVTYDNRALSLSAGLVNVGGSASSVSTAIANATAVTGGLSSAEQATGASRTAQAPPSTSIPATSQPAGGLPSWDCLFACWSPSMVGTAAVAAQNGLPTAGSSAFPVQAAITDTSTNSGFKFGTIGDTSTYRPGLQLTGALVRMSTSDAPLPSQLTRCAVTASGSVTASGYLQTTEGSSAGVDSCAVARSTPVALFPTTFAPQGVVRVSLQHASARCTATATNGTAAFDYSARIEVWDGTSFTVVAEPLSGQTSDPLAAVPMTMSVGGGRTLGDYIASWASAVTDPSGASGGSVRTQQAARRAHVSIPGVVTIASTPVRSDTASPDGLDASSPVAVTVGALGCSVEDDR